FTDFFGGRSSGYEDKLSKIYDEAILAIKNKAERKKANGLVGLKIDVSEISGKGTQMFMITAVATPVFIGMSDDNNRVNDDTIDNDVVNAKLRANDILNSKQSLYKLTKSDIQFMVQSVFVEFSQFVLDHIDDVDQGDEVLRTKINMLPSYFENIPLSTAKEIVYSELAKEESRRTQRRILFKVLRDLDLVDYNIAIGKLLKSGKYPKMSAVFILMED